MSVLHCSMGCVARLGVAGQRGGSLNDKEYTRGRDVAQIMEHTVKWWEGDDHRRGILVRCRRKVVVAGSISGNPH